jgi:hypothetical protein
MGFYVFWSLTFGLGPRFGLSAACLWYSASRWRITARGTEITLRTNASNARYASGPSSGAGFGFMVSGYHQNSPFVDDDPFVY